MSSMTRKMRMRRRVTPSSPSCAVISPPSFSLLILFVLLLFSRQSILLSSCWKYPAATIAADAAAVEGDTSTSSSPNDASEPAKKKDIKLSGKVVSSSSGKVLNRYPEVKSFLKDGEATFYHDVVVRYVQDDEKSPVLIVQSDDGSSTGTKKEMIELTDYSTKEELHQLMIEKGFRRKSEKEIEDIIKYTKMWNQSELEVEQQRAARKKQREERKKRQDEMGEELRQLSQIGGEEGKRLVREKLEEMKQKLHGRGRLVGADEPEL